MSLKTVGIEQLGKPFGILVTRLMLYFGVFEGSIISAAENSKVFENYGFSLKFETQANV